MTDAGAFLVLVLRIDYALITMVRNDLSELASLAFLCKSVYYLVIVNCNSCTEKLYNKSDYYLHKDKANNTSVVGWTLTSVRRIVLASTARRHVSASVTLVEVQLTSSAS